MSKFLPVNEQLKIIERGVVELLPMNEMKDKLERSYKENKPLIIKQGFDPTAPDIHLGHTVGLRKLKHFQELGHQIVLIIGDYTGMVGDPSDKKSTRPRLTHEQVMEHAETYRTQFFKVLDPEKTIVRLNGEWFAKMNFAEVMGLASKFTVARMLERDDFSKRYTSQLPISIHEFFYPLMQGYDSVEIKADVEIGATEQKFNLIIGRQIQQEYGVEQQIVLTLPVLPGLDGVQRMSKSLGNYIGIDEAPEEIYGKTMRITDDMIYTYYELVTDVEIDELKEIKEQLETEGNNPRDIKHNLAFTLTRMYHGKEKAEQAKQHFEKLFIKKDIPDEMEKITVEAGIQILQIMADEKMISSKSEGRRLFKQGGISVNQEKIDDAAKTLDENGEYVLKVGKRKFLKIFVQ
ncbi:MAG: tyrosine--tRNA ligase [Calditrichia bacterium]|nr:tyrosine--tRNA ligase [Calditrichia bacterium]